MTRSIPHRKLFSRLALSPLALAVVALSTSARAEDEAKPPNAALGLDPAAPQVAALPGGMVPAMGKPAAGPGDWRFDFHGMLTAPLRAGLNTRETCDPSTGDPRCRHPGQSKNVLHAPPLVPDDPDTFSHTSVVPVPYTQLNFSYGNSVVTATASIVAKVNSVSAGFLDPASQLGINDAFVTFNLPDVGKNMFFRVNVGAFSNRYGGMGEYDEGRYGQPLIARVNGVGENIQANFRFGDLTLLLEQGVVGASGRPGGGILPDAYNGFADQRVGATFATHFHAGLNYKSLVTLAGHYIHAWSQDERAAPYDVPDGKIGVLAADLRLTMGRFGHLYAAYSHTDADYAASVGRVIEVMNTRGGAGLEQNYFSGTGSPAGPGTGKLSTIGGQYDLSVGRLVSYPVPFTGDGPDVVLSLFGVSTKVTSNDRLTDGITKLKLGAEGTYSLLPWLAASARYDRVSPNSDDQHYSFAVVSPRLILRTGWESHDQVVLQYSHWFNGSFTTIRTGYPPRDDLTAIPDEDVISLSASMWW